MASSGKKFHPFAIVVLAALTTRILGCGGSASETPPPLEPDPHAIPEHPTVESAPRPASMNDSDDEAAPASPRAHGTWGGGRAGPRSYANADGGQNAPSNWTPP